MFLKTKFYAILIGSLVFLLLLTLFFLITNISKPVKMHYYFFNACGSCNETSEFKEQLYNILKDGTQDRTYQLLTYNVFRSEKEYEAQCTKLGIEVIRNWPVLIVGDQVLYGESAIRENVLQAFLSYRDGLTVFLYIGCSVVLLTLIAAIAYGRLRALQ